MLIHTVYFWLKDEIGDGERAAFRETLAGLSAIDATDALYVGTPAETDRPIIDRSYDVGLTVVFKDLAAHDIYQDHPLHQDFITKFKHCWDRLVIYDFD